MKFDPKRRRAISDLALTFVQKERPWNTRTAWP